MPAGDREEPVRPAVMPHPGRPAPASIPRTVLRAGWAIIPTSRVTNVVNIGALKHGRNDSSTRRSDPGRVGTRSIGGNSLQVGL
jgi:hypothetical protein